MRDSLFHGSKELLTTTVHTPPHTHTANTVCTWPTYPATVTHCKCTIYVQYYSTYHSEEILYLHKDTTQYKQPSSSSLIKHTVCSSLVHFPRFSLKSVDILEFEWWLMKWTLQVPLSLMSDLTHCWIKAQATSQNLRRNYHFTKGFINLSAAMRK